MIDSIPADEIISRIVDSPFEARNVELKPSTPWNGIEKHYELQRIVMSILGMSNIKNGGKIILGIRQNPDRTFAVEGMKTEHLMTFEQDNIYQIVKAYGNPAPIFDIKNIEYNGLYFIVFSIQQFLYSPVICSKPGTKCFNGKEELEPLIRGALYSRSFKPETKRVNSETEMREIIDLAIDGEFEHLSPRVKNLLTILKHSGKKSKKSNDKSLFLKELKDVKK